MIEKLNLEGAVIAATSDFHVGGLAPNGGHFRRHVSALLDKYGPEILLQTDHIIVGDDDPQVAGKWEANAAYNEVLKLRKKRGKAKEELTLNPEQDAAYNKETTKLCKEARDNAWKNPYLLRSLIPYAKTSQKLSEEYVSSVAELAESGVIVAPVHVVPGNTRALVKGDQLKGLEAAGIEGKLTIAELVEGSEYIVEHKNPTFTQYGNEAVVLSIPYSKDGATQEQYCKDLDSLKKDGKVKECILYIHEPLWPEALGKKNKPVTMDRSFDMLDIIHEKYPEAKIRVVSGHTHTIPEDKHEIQITDNEYLYPVGMNADSNPEKVFGRTLVIDPLNKRMEKVDYKLCD